MKNPIVYLIIVIDFLVLFTQTSELSISYNEASLLYGDTSALQLLIRLSLYLFGANDFALRLPMILMHSASTFLLYILSDRYLSSQRNKNWLILIFVLLPGVISSALVVNDAGLIILGLFIFSYIYQRNSLIMSNVLMGVYLFISPGFIYLYFGMMVFYLYSKKKLYALYSAGLFFLSMYFYGFKTYGIPRGHFLDTLGIYAAVFTPIIFIFIFYALYRRLLVGKIDFIWYISSSTLIFSLLLSLRQKIQLEYFAPYLMIALPQVAQTFIHSYRIRLPRFRKRYKLIFGISLLLLSFNYFVVIFNKELYLYLDNPKKHFAYESYIAHSVANQLSKRNIHCVKTDSEMQLRLKFYGIAECDKNSLIENDSVNNVTISYKSKVLYRANVTILNKL